MTKQDYYKQGKSLLKGVIAQRKWLLEHKKGYLNPEFTRQQIMNLEYALSKINSADKMRSYIERKESMLRLMIPTTNKKRIKKLRELVTAQLN